MESFNNYISRIIKEFDYSNAHVYNRDDYQSPLVAYKEFIKLNPKVKDTKKTTMKQVQNFIRNVYKSGDHEVSKKKFIKVLLNNGVRICNRNNKLCPSGYKNNNIKESIKIEIKKMLNEEKKQTDEEWIKD